MPVLELPHAFDPSRGWIATANQDNLPRGYPFAVGFQWTDPFRFARIEEVLGSGRRLTMTDMTPYGSLVFQGGSGNPRTTFSYKSGERFQSSRSRCCTSVKGVSNA